MDRRRPRTVSIYAQPKLGKSSLQKAKELLRKAAKDGNLREILWGKDWNNVKKKIAIEAAKQEIKNAVPDDQAPLPPIDDVAIWNRLLAARVMRTVSLLTQQFAIDAAAAEEEEEEEEEEEDEDDEDEKEFDFDEPDINDEEKVADEVNDSPRPLSRSSSPSSNKRQQLNNGKQRGSHHIKEKQRKKKEFQQQSENEAKNKAKPSDDIDFFLNILNNKQSKGPRRVSQIIKEAKDRDNDNKRKSGVLDTMEEESEDRSERSSSAASSTRGSESGHVRWGGTTNKRQQSTNKAKKNLSSSAKQASIDFGIASLLHPRDKSAKSIMQQQEKKRKMSKHQAELASFRSIQVVEGLFAMSNELLMERESILARSSNLNSNRDDNNSNNDAFINRNATLKYNEQLEEVAQSRLDSLSFQRKAALIRLRKSSNKFKSVYHSTNLARFASFWSTLQEINERIDEGNLRVTGQTCYEGYHAPLLAAKSDDDLDRDDHKQGTLTGGMGALESMLEENLGLLFATKTKAGIANNSRLTTANSRGVGAGRRRGSATGGSSRGKKQSSDGFDNDDFNDDEEDEEDNDDDDDEEDGDYFEDEQGRNTTDQIPFQGGGGGDVLLNNNQRNLSTVIDRMKAMGIYSDDKFRFIYGMPPRGGNKAAVTPLNASNSKRKGSEGSPTHSSKSPSMMDRWLEHHDDGDDSEEGGSSSGKHQFLKKGSRMKLTGSSSAALYQANNNSRFRMDANSVDLLLSLEGEQEQRLQSETEKEKQKEMFLTQRILSFTDAMGEEKYEENGGKTEENVTENDETEANEQNKTKRPYLSKQSIRPFDEKENRPVVDILGLDRIHLTAMEPTTISPQPRGIVEGSVATDSNIHGRYQYDESLPVLTRPVVIRREEDRLRETTLDLQHRKNLFMHNRFHLGDEKQKKLLHLSHNNDVYQELTFDPTSCQLVLSSFSNNELHHQHAVDISTVFFTESQLAGMITIRCQPSHDVPSGYLGSFPTEQWLVMEEEMNTAMILHRLQVHKQQQQQKTVARRDIHHTTTGVDDPASNSNNEFIAVPRFSSLQGQQAGDVNLSLPGLTLAHPPMKRKGSILISEGDDADYDQDTEDYDPHPLEHLLPSWDDIMRQAAITAKYAQRPSSAPDNNNNQEKADEEKRQEKQAMMQQQHPEVILMNDHRPLQSMTIRAKPTTTTNNNNVRGSTSQLPSSSAISLSQSLKVQPLAALPPRQPKSSGASFRTKRMLALLAKEEEAAATATAQQEQFAATGEDAQALMPFDFQSLRIGIPTKPEPEEDLRAEEATEEEIALDSLPFNFDFQIVQLVESRRIMQLYFTKKFLQLDLPVNVHLTIYDAAESLLEAPGLYGIIFVSYLDLTRNGSKMDDLQKALQDLLPVELDKMRFSIFVYDVSVNAKNEESKDDEDKDSDDGKDSSSSSSSSGSDSSDSDDADEILATLEFCGVTDVIHPPYDIATLKNALATHQRKQEFRMQFAAAAAFGHSGGNRVGDSFYN